jgi:drug/metabolite transporter (DMT)-like permease
MTARRSSSLRELFSSGAPLSIVFGGTSFIATRIALRCFDPLTIVAARFVLGAALLFLVLRVRGEKLFPERADRPRCALLGLVIAAHLLIQAFAMQHTSAIHSGWIVGFSPVAIALGAQLFLRERLRAIGWLGAACASAGVFVVTLAKTPDFSRAGTGDLLMLSSCLSWAAYTLLGSRPVATSGSLRVNAFSMSVAAAVAGLALLASAPAGGLVAGDGDLRDGLLAVLFLGCICNGVSFAIWARVVERFGAAQTGALLYFQPFVTLIAALLVLHEPLGAPALLGGPLVLFGVALVRRGAGPARAVPARG